MGGSADVEQDLNSDVVEHLRVAERGRAVFEAAGLTVRGWEPYCLAFTEPDLLRRELSREGPPDPDLARRLQALRDEIDPLLGKVSGLIPSETPAGREADLRDMLLGFIAGSPSARAAASKWIAEPERYAEEAVQRLSAIETFVDRCRSALRAPARPVAQPGRARVALVWPAVPGAVRYQVQRSIRPGGPYETVAAPEGPSYTDAGLTGGTTYYYVVRAFHTSGPSAPSPETAAAPLLLLSAPEGLRAEPGGGMIRLTWSPVAGAQRYRVMRSTADGGPYSAIAQPAEATFVDPNLQNGTAYFYTVRAVNDIGKGAYSPAVSATPLPSPAAPRDLNAAPAKGCVQLRWAAAEGAVTYTVKRATSPSGPFLPIAGATGLSLSDPTISNGTSYYYVVSAANSAGESPDSAAAEVVPLAPPVPPGRPRASASSGRVVLEWDPVPGSAAYVVLRGTLQESPAPLAVLAAPPLLDETVRDGETYVYALLARNSGGDSAPSESVQAEPRVAPPPPPGRLAARSGDARVHLTWEPAPGACSYLVHRAAANGQPFTQLGAADSTSYADTTAVNGQTYVYAVSAVNPGGVSAYSGSAIATPLASPAGLRAVPASGQIALTWEPVPGAQVYEILRAAGSAGPFVSIARTPAVAYIDGTVPPERPAFYTVAAVGLAGESAPSEVVTAAPLSALPEAPASLVASASSGVVKLAWPASAGAFDYIVRRAPSPEGPFTAIGTVPGTGFADATVRDGTTYHYQVTALNAGGESPPSTVVSATPIAPPAAPAVPRVTAGDDANRLEWDAVERAEAYVVRRAEAGQEPKIVARLRETSWADAMAARGTSYAYTISAVNTAGESEPSAAGTSTPPAPPPAPPPPPSGITGSSTDSEVTVRWTAAPGAERYRVKRATTREGPYKTVAEVREPTWTDRSVENGKTYFYTVRSVGAGGKSGFSARLRATPNARPGSPTGLAAAAGDGEVSLAWRPVDKAVGYKIKRAASAEGPWATAGTTRHPSWMDRGLANGETYWYAVTSVIAGIESDPSPALSARPAKDAQPPTLESLAAPAASPETLPPGVDMEKLQDLRHGEQLRGFFAETGQKFEPWELLTLLAEDGAGARKAIETVLRQREEARPDFTTGAIALFERILKVRAAHGGFVRRLREYMGSLELDGAGPAAGTAALEIALGFLVSAPKGRQRAELWLREADARRREAAEFLFHASCLARNYIAAMQDQNDG